MDGIITVIDFETTSRSAVEARATEIGLVALDSNFNEVARYETLIRPPVEANYFAQKVSGISSKMTAQAHPFQDYWPDIVPFLHNRILIAHNADYDMQVLVNELEYLDEPACPPAICTLRMAQRVFPKSMAGDHTLVSLARHFGLEYAAHQAVSDAATTGKLLRIMIEHAQVEKEKIVQASKLIQSLKHPEKVAKKPVTRDSIIDPGYLQRSGLTSTPSALEVRSNSELKLLAKSLLSGSKRNIALTGTPSMGKESFAQMALKIGFEYSRNPVGKRYTALLVVGIAETGQTKIHDANQNGVPVVNDSEWIALNLLLQELQRI